MPERTRRVNNGRVSPVRALLLTTCTPDDNKVVACARSIHASGGVVDVASDRFLGQAYWSRSVRKRVRLPHPQSGRAYIDAINRLAHIRDWNVLLPLNDYTMHAAVTHRAVLDPSLKAALPDPAAWAISRDKLRLAELAREAGVAAPLTFSPSDEYEAVEAARSTGYPCVVKLRSGCGAVGRRYVRTEAELRALFRQERDASDTVFDFDHLLVQQYIDGEPRDLCAIFAHGEPRSFYTQRKIRTWPTDGGRSAIVETTDDPTVREAGLTIMRALRWHGAIETEFRVDRRTRIPYLLDANGRFWAVLGLSVAAGLDFPTMYCRLGLDGDIKPRFNYKVGVRMRWPFPFALLTCLKAPGRSQILSDFLLPRVNTVSDWQWSDPVPHLAEHLYLFLRGVRRVFSPSAAEWWR